jgi:type I restriction enzyme S subunit
MYGGFGQIGRTARLGIDATTNQAISALTELRPDVLPTFVHEVLKAGRAKWRRVAASSRKDPNITKANVEEFDFPLPPIDQQREIVDLIAAQASSAAALQAELAALRAVRADLLTALMSQEITVNAAVDKFVKAD